ncbi:3-oxoacyl-ACP synthase [Candidatus Nitrospira salsa]
MYITSTGMVCPVGLNAESACAAMRAGITGFGELPYLDNDGEPIVGAMTPGSDPDFKFEQRLTEMMTAAVTDCLKDSPTISLENIPLIACLPESDRPGIPVELADRIIALIEEKLQLKFHPELSRTISNGHTSGFQALQIARELFMAKNVSTCLICSVDSYINARSLLWLDQFFRLKTQKNSDGIIPGEGAAAILACANENTNSVTGTKLIGLGFGTEQATIMNEDPLLGLGLTEASKMALSEAGIQMHEIGFRLSDVTGESYGFREQALMIARILRVHREEDYPIWHCSECIGNTGAATGVIQLIIAFHAFQRGYAKGEIVMCFTSADSGKRAVALIASRRVGRKTNV